jgi:hypothetical protein
MQDQIPSVAHPIPLETKVTVLKPSCPCKNAKYETVTGVVKKVIQNQTGYWYYLDIGITVKDAWVQFTG